jgi:hypothetical protein
MTFGTLMSGVSVGQILLKCLPLRKVEAQEITFDKHGLWPSRLLHIFRLLQQSFKKTYVEENLSVCNILSTLKWLNIFSFFYFVLDLALESH